MKYFFASLIKVCHLEISFLVVTEEKVVQLKNCKSLPDYLRSQKWPFLAICAINVFHEIINLYRYFAVGMS